MAFRNESTGGSLRRFYPRIHAPHGGDHGKGLYEHRSVNRPTASLQAQSSPQVESSSSPPPSSSTPPPPNPPAPSSSTPPPSGGAVSSSSSTIPPSSSSSMP